MQSVAPIVFALMHMPLMLTTAAVEPTRKIECFTPPDLALIDSPGSVLTTITVLLCIVKLASMAIRPCERANGWRTGIVGLSMLTASVGLIVIRILSYMPETIVVLYFGRREGPRTGGITSMPHYEQWCIYGTIALVVMLLLCVLSTRPSKKGEQVGGGDGEKPAS